jgi:hypothetical protein
MVKVVLPVAAVPVKAPVEALMLNHAGLLHVVGQVQV